MALLVGGAWVVGCIAYAVFSEPYVSLTYAIETYGAPAAPADGCKTNDGTQYTSVETPDHKSIGLTLCFTASRADNGNYLIPYRLVASPSNPEAARIYEARKEALRQGEQAHAASLAEMLLKIPVTPWESQTMWMAVDHDAEVRRYMEGVAAQFKLRPNDLERLKTIKRQKLWEQYKLALQFLFGGVAVWWALVTAVGWIVRGFMGIPRGADRLPPA